jgi:hypothetical protein
MLNLRRLRDAFEAGNEAALREAACICLEGDGENVKVPRWILEALNERHATYMRKLARGADKGRHARWVQMFRQDQVDFARYDIVCEGLERKQELGLRWTDDGVFEAAAAVSRDTRYKGSAGQFKDSYYRVKNRQEKAPWRYLLFRFTRAC